MGEQRAGLVVGVQLRLFTTEEGGRKSGVSGEPYSYRPNWDVAGRKDPLSQTGAPVLCLDRLWLHPGESTRAVLVPLSPEAWHAVGEGDRIYLYEGPRLCGDAVVTIIRPAFLPLSDDEENSWRDWALGTLSAWESAR
ncbi:hypothetical protein Aple_011140 [Acrocarpospora pleiomorpha]|uniref:Uncharacterized protein n=1 Tax=Acrocarpospora pleiomorpha TaxID=90975 RepID=A0A5M3XDE0_9ACTN|nr:hypothetical protein Aple_011140 [Acrocarpospora pleiomorpha]